MKNNPKTKQDEKHYSKKKLKKLIDNQKWTFAKSYSRFAPHEYITREQNPTICELMDVAIKKDGMKESFKYPGGQKQWTYLYLGKFKYWWTNKGFVLNRCPANQTQDWSDGPKPAITKKIFHERANQVEVD